MTKGQSGLLFLAVRDFHSLLFVDLPTVKSDWCRSGKVEVEDIPNLNIRQTQMHGNNSSGRYAVSSTSAFTSVSAIFPGNAPMPPSQGQASIPGPCIAPRRSHVGSRTAPAFGYRTWGKFIFAKRCEVQISCANNAFNLVYAVMSCRILGPANICPN